MCTTCGKLSKEKLGQQRKEIVYYTTKRTKRKTITRRKTQTKKHDKARIPKRKSSKRNR